VWHARLIRLQPAIMKLGKDAYRVIPGHHPIVATGKTNVARRVLRRHGGGGGNSNDHHAVKYR
jgi:hypothetical protein